MVIGDLGDHASWLPTLALGPWLAQLFVEPARRGDGFGAALVRAVLDRARACGYARVYRYTSGTLPDYDRGLGWRVVEQLPYLDRERTVMDHDLAPDIGMRAT